MSDMLSQEEIDALLKGTDEPINSNDSIELTEDEKDTIGEVGNISMGTAATTLSTLLGERVSITTPKVKLLSLSELTKEYPLPFVAINVKYKEGLEGTNLLILKQKDVRIITDLMMDGDGKEQTDELTDLHLSAISEAMNQMVGSSSTSLSELLNKKIDINPPKAFVLSLTVDNLVEHFSNDTDVFVRISFKMVIGDLIDSEIMQLMPVEFAKTMVKGLLNDISDTDINVVSDAMDTNDANVSTQQVHQSHTNSDNPNVRENTYSMETNNHNIEKETRQVGPNEKVNIRPVQFQSFDEPSIKEEVPENIALIQDVPLKITVELGRTVKKISEILEFGHGTIVELDKLVGEPLDILVNGQYVAKGEVVVIDENYGMRVTDIVNPVKRFSKAYK